MQYHVGVGRALIMLTEVGRFESLYPWSICGSVLRYDAEPHGTGKCEATVIKVLYRMIE